MAHVAFGFSVWQEQKILNAMGIAVLVVSEDGITAAGKYLPCWQAYSRSAIDSDYFTED